THRFTFRVVIVEMRVLRIDNPLVERAPILRRRHFRDVGGVAVHPVRVELRDGFDRLHTVAVSAAEFRGAHRPVIRATRTPILVALHPRVRPTVQNLGTTVERGLGPHRTVGEPLRGTPNRVATLPDLSDLGLDRLEPGQRVTLETTFGEGASLDEKRVALPIE